jgi:hypothetical protein
MEPTQSPTHAPEYAKHRENVTTVDTLPITNPDRGMNMLGFITANIQVIPSGGANPTVQVLWWSEEAQRFVQEHTPISRAGVGADTPFEFSVNAANRRLFVAVTTLAAGAVKIMVSGSELDHYR